MNNTEELELIEQARSCSREAFDQLVDCYQKPLIGFIRGRGVKPPDHDDVAQEVWIKVWDKIHAPSDDGGYDDTQGTFYTWVTSCFAVYEILRYRSARPSARVWTGTDEQEEDREVEIADSGYEPLPEEELRLRFAAYSEMLRLTLLCGGYPHEQIAFVLAKLVYGSQSDRGTEGVPQHVDQMHGAARLESLAPTTWEAYLTATGLGDSSLMAMVREASKPVQLRLALTVEELIKPSLEHLEALGPRKVARTCLRDYYARNPDEEGPRNHPITHWCYRVRRKMCRVLGLKNDADPGATTESLAGKAGDGPVDPEHCQRCKLRAVPPCG